MYSKKKLVKYDWHLSIHFTISKKHELIILTNDYFLCLDNIDHVSTRRYVIGAAPNRSKNVSDRPSVSTCIGALRPIFWAAPMCVAPMLKVIQLVPDRYGPLRCSLFSIQFSDCVSTCIGVIFVPDSFLGRSDISSSGNTWKWYIEALNWIDFFKQRIFYLYSFYY